MKVKVCYSKSSLEGAADFLSKNNPFFKGQYSYIKEKIIESIFEMGKSVMQDMQISTMGFTLVADYVEIESIDDEENIVHIDILVNPGIGKSSYDEEDEGELVVDIPLESKVK